MEGVVNEEEVDTYKQRIGVNLVGERASERMKRTEEREGESEDESDQVACLMEACGENSAGEEKLVEENGKCAAARVRSCR